jgi:hypothetical protein
MYLENNVNFKGYDSASDILEESDNIRKLRDLLARRQVSLPKDPRGRAGDP